jgi:hypothetical protein
MKPIAIFYHLWQAEGWEELYMSQMNRLFCSGLGIAAQYIHIGINGSIMPRSSLIPSNAKVVFNTHHDKEGDTLKSCHDYCQSCDPNTRIMYFHSKGLSRKNNMIPEHYLNVYHWRLYMEYFIIDKWKECCKKLDKYDCAGVKYLCDGHWGRAPHFSGNFWWAKSSHIKNLNTEMLSSFQGAEFWLMHQMSIETIDKKICNLDAHIDFSGNMGYWGDISLETYTK